MHGRFQRGDFFPHSPPSVTLSAIVGLSLLFGTGCPEPKGATDVKKELDDYTNKIESEMFTKEGARGREIRDQCLVVAGADAAKRQMCEQELLERLRAADTSAKQFTTDTLVWNRRVFDNFNEKWEESSNKERAAIKNGIMEQIRDASKKFTNRVPGADTQKSMVSRILKAATNTQIREQLAPFNPTITISAAGRIVGTLGPGSFRVDFDSSVGPNTATLDLFTSQTSSFSGSISFSASPDTMDANVLRLAITDARITASNLDFDAVSTGDNTMTFTGEEPGSGTINLLTRQVALSVPLMVENDYMPSGVQFININVSGDVRQVGSDNVLILSFQGPFANLFPSEAPDPLVNLEMDIGISGATLDLGDATTLTIPAGALTMPTTISLMFTGEMPTPTSVPATFAKIGITRRVLSANQSFTAPATLVIPFNEADVQDLDKSTLRGFFFDPVTSAWQLIADSTVDVRAGLVSLRFTNTGSGLFAIGGKPISGDLNGDGKVDTADLQIILAILNTDASGPDDPRDLNKDGRIDALDARILTTLCSQPACAN